MLYYEWRKIGNHKLILLLCLLFLATGIIGQIELRSVSRGDQSQRLWEVYKEVEGPLSEETEAQIMLSWQEIKECIGKQGEMESLFLRQEIGREEYLAYCTELREAQRIEKAMESLLQRYEEMKMFDGALVYDLYYNCYLGPNDLPYGLLFSTLLLGVAIGIIENEGVTKLLMVTKRGYAGVLRAKILVAAGLSAILGIAYTGTQYLQAYLAFPFRQLSAPVQSLEVMMGSALRVNIGQWMVLLAAGRILMAVLLGVGTVLVHQLIVCGRKR